MDSDAVASMDWLRQLLVPYVAPDVASVGGPAYPVWLQPPPLWFTTRFNWMIGCTHQQNADSMSEVERLLGCNMSMRREAFTKVGLFDPRLGRKAGSLVSGEETEWLVRLKRRAPGSRVVFSPGASVFHKVPGNRIQLNYLIRRAFYGGVSAMSAWRITRFAEMRSEAVYLTQTLLNIDRNQTLRLPTIRSRLFGLAVIGLEVTGALVSLMRPIGHAEI